MILEFMLMETSYSLTFGELLNVTVNIPAFNVTPRSFSLLSLSFLSIFGAVPFHPNHTTQHPENRGRRRYKG
jgi:hypothetical protein